ncbi:hypothetical protein IWQ60_011572 [Tieghemiomyces parasiticus]|uniref:Elongator complex protein 5 n=1 Tax=Tieghemiomyces parasiticus TaxID=78921 RepID=A0A9W7ZGV9_9FUNG|nr:hypothetical protein IWQ60_011572 [Tieghemiomyces parasiticus]
MASYTTPYPAKDLLHLALTFQLLARFVPIFDSVRQSGLPLLRYALNRRVRRRLNPTSATTAKSEGTSPPSSAQTWPGGNLHPSQRSRRVGYVLWCLETWPDTLLPEGETCDEDGDLSDVAVVVGVGAGVNVMPPGRTRIQEKARSFTLLNDVGEVSRTYEALKQSVVEMTSHYTDVHIIFDSLAPLFDQSVPHTIRFLRKVLDIRADPLIGTGDPAPAVIIRLLGLIHRDRYADETHRGGDPGSHTDTTTSGLPLQAALEFISPIGITLHTHTDYARRRDPLLWSEEDDHHPAYRLDSECHVTDRGVAEIEYFRKDNKADQVAVTYSIVKGKLTSTVFVNERYLKPEQPDKGASSPGKPASETTLTQDLSFNLELTDQQREAKNNLVLPHETAQSNETAPSGAIFYQPDAADDFDEEDPDDDLDI